jgi:hypothetical protein
MPINTEIYIAAYSGAMSGMGASDKIPLFNMAADYAALASIAGGFASAVDIAFDNSANTELDIAILESICEGIWNGRTPFYGGQFLIPATYAREAEAVVAMVNAADLYFIANGINPSPGGGGGGGGLPPVANVLGATIVENPAGTRVSQRLKQSFIDPNFAIASWAKSGPNAGQLLYRRGDIIAGLTANASYVSGPPTSASAVSVSANGAVSVGAWAILSPFAVANKSGTSTGDGTDVTADPTIINTLTANDGSGPVTNAFTLTFTSDVYALVTANPVIIGDDVFQGVLQAGAQESLQQNRNKIWVLNQVGQYAYFLWPDRIAYTNGTPTFKDQNGFIYATVLQGTTTIVRNGLVQTYKVYRSAAALNNPFTVTIT